MKKLIAVLIILLCCASFYFGYRFKDPKVITTTHTEYVYDTITHYIKDSAPWYHVVLDTVTYNDTIPVNLDTVAIIKDYFAKHTYTRNWEDTLVKVEVTDVISMNKPVNNQFSYVIKRPQTIINNVTNVNSDNRRVYLGLMFKEIGYPELEVNVTNNITPRMIYGLQYDIEMKVLKFKMGYNIWPKKK